MFLDAYLPDSGLQSFLNDHVVIQSVGLFIVAITMSLVLAKRTKFLQDELNDYQKMMKLRRESYWKRLFELKRMMEGISNQLAKYIPPQFMKHCLQERLTQRSQHEEGSLF